MSIFQKQHKKISFDDVAMFLTFLLIGGTAYSVNTIIAQTKYLGFQFQIVDFFITCFGIIFPILMHEVGKYIIKKNTWFIKRDLYFNQTWQEKLQSMGQNLGEFLRYFIVLGFAYVFSYKTKYGPQDLFLTMDLTDFRKPEPFNQVPDYVRYVYLLELGYSLRKIVLLLTKQSPYSLKSFHVFLFHHLFSFLQIGLSYILGCTRWGFPIILTHEINDALMKFNRVFRQFKISDIYSKAFFVFFGFSWMYLRVYRYFMDIVLAIYFLNTRNLQPNHKNQFLQKAFFVALFMLFVLNIYWGCEIIVAAIKKLLYNRNDRVIEYKKIQQKSSIEKISNQQVKKIIFVFNKNQNFSILYLLINFFI